MYSGDQLYGMFCFGFMLAVILCFSLGMFMTRETKKPYERTFTSRVRVPATWVNNDPDYNALMRDGVADFQLGPGPCGLTVTALEADWAYPNKENFSVTQRCSNGESKTFHYRREDITGRIEVSYEKEWVDPKNKS